MGLFLCPICEDNLKFDNEQCLVPHVCDPQILKEHINTLKEQARTATIDLNNIKNAVFTILQTLPSMVGEEVTIKTEDLKRLWESAECRWYKAKTADDFLVRWLVTHRVLTEAYDLFQSKEGTLLEKLKQLKEVVDESRIVLEYEDSEFDLTPEDLAK